ncbi:permease prefix domain 2-containing transporter [Dyadobacter sp. CY347]|uniref:permease prefix domain 2-containing transporter n=1 Tax=Dyadobacter sp. CY347 TaxID=2909336 RepID=UPI001F3E216A|nr:permease prefix domain 2-containing transporter [Dyadobacter sp. CY347]MCF2488010.1 ABC transporter permease [Dyadobacter sp. CY347]
MADQHSEPTPPDWADFFLKWTCPSEQHEEILGDLHEQFTIDASALGETVARRRYLLQVLKFSRPYFLKRKINALSEPATYPTPFFVNADMIKNYYKIAFRTFQRGHIYSFINLFGLAVGLAGVMLIISYVFYELSFDKHYSNSDRIYQLVMENRKTSPIERNIVVPVALGPTLTQEVPEVEAFTSFNAYELVFLKNEKPLRSIR